MARRAHLTDVGVENAAVLGPGHEVGRRKGVEKHLPVIRSGVGGIDPVFLAKDDASGSAYQP